MKGIKYIVRGDVRGTISKHRELSTAVKSLRRDMIACRYVGGYSDCEIIHADGTELDEIESAYIGEFAYPHSRCRAKSDKFRY
jgi:hypothetical protein